MYFSSHAEINNEMTIKMLPRLKVGFRAFKSPPINPLPPSDAVQKQENILEDLFRSVL